MCSAEEVTKFVIRKDRWITSVGTFGYHGEAKKALEDAGLSADNGAIKHEIDMCKVVDIVKALERHCKAALKLESLDYFTASSAFKYDNPDKTVPVKRAWDIAFAVEGGSEGYYVHFGSVLRGEKVGEQAGYFDYGFAKLYDRAEASALCTEAQRFLTSAGWN